MLAIRLLFKTKWQKNHIECGFNNLLCHLIMEQVDKQQCLRYKDSLQDIIVQQIWSNLVNLSGITDPEMNWTCAWFCSRLWVRLHRANHKSLYEDSTVTSAREKFKFYCVFVFNEKMVPNHIEFDFNNLLYHLVVSYH